MAAPSAVFTTARVAQMLGEDEAWLDELADQLEPEDGCLWIYDTDGRATLGFTTRGVESLIARSGDRPQIASAQHPRPSPDGYCYTSRPRVRPLPKIAW